MIKINPEIRKYIWLEISIQRLLMIPLVLGIIFYILSETAKAKTGYNHLLFHSFRGIYFAFVIAWGASRSYFSFKDEEKYKTWDFQRLSSLQPEKIIIGKIFGSTILCWYIALFCLPVIFSASYNLYGFDKAVTEIVTYILFTIIVYLLGFFFAITALDKTIKFISLLFFLHLLAFFLLFFLSDRGFSEYVWYGTKYNYDYFNILLCLLVLLWLFLFTYVKVRKVLKMNTSQVSWLIFLIFISFFIYGFLPLGKSSGFLIIFYINIYLVYFSALIENQDGIHYKKLFYYWKEKNLERIVELIPKYLISIFFCFFLVICSFFIPVSTLKIARNEIEIATSTAISLGVLLAVIRDIIIYHYFKLGKNPQRAILNTVFWLALIHIILPMFFSVVGLKFLSSALSPFLLYDRALIGLLHDGVIRGNFLLLLQIIFASYLVLSRWKKYWQND